MNKVIINCKIIKQNINLIKNIIGEKTKVCAVVKANAYNFNANVICPAIEGEVDYFAVATIGEAQLLRSAGIKKEILLLGVCTDFLLAEKLNLNITIGSIFEGKELVKTKAKVRVHIKVNTGMNRYGITKLSELNTLLKLFKNKVDINGLYTHMAHEEDNIKKIEQQVALFMPFVLKVKSINKNAIVHAAASGSLRVKCAQFDMVRPGKALYGGVCYTKTALKATSQICKMQTLKKPAEIGYSGGGLASGKIGIVPVGYFDYFSRANSNVGKVLVAGKLCDVVGNVCMDCFMVKLDKASKQGDEVVLFDSQTNITLMDAHLRNKEIVCQMLCNMNFYRCNVQFIK